MSGIQRNDLRVSRLFVGLAGAELECINSEGEPMWTVGVSPGVHFADKYMEYMGPDDTLSISGTASLLYRGGRVRSQSFGPVAFESGANPNFRPTSYSEAEARMRRLLDQSAAAERRMAKRERSLRALAEKVKTPDVIDKGDDPKPEPKEPEQSKGEQSSPAVQPEEVEPQSDE